MLACNSESLHTLTPPVVVFRVLARPLFAFCSYVHAGLRYAQGAQ